MPQVIVWKKVPGSTSTFFCAACRGHTKHELFTDGKRTQVCCVPCHEREQSMVTFVEIQGEA